MTAVAFKHSFKDKFRIFRDRRGVVSADIFDYLKGDHASRTVDVRVYMYSFSYARGESAVKGVIQSAGLCELILSHIKRAFVWTGYFTACLISVVHKGKEVVVGVVVGVKSYDKVVFLSAG